MIVVAVLEKEISDVIHCKIQNIFLTTPSPSGSFTSYVWHSFQISLRKQKTVNRLYKVNDHA